MDCLRPITIPNPDYEAGGKILVPCGHCEACICNNAQSWRIRLQEEFNASTSAFFITLTYSDHRLRYERCTDSFGNVVFAPVVSKKDVQNFFKRLRITLERAYINFSLKYFLVSEYGPTSLRPHYHAIIFGLPVLNKNPYLQKVKILKLLEEVWDNGYVKVDPVTFGRISYVTKYVCSVTELPEYLRDFKPFRLISKGLGKSYLDNDELIDWHRRTYSAFVPRGTYRLPMPRYYKDKIFDDEMKHVISENFKEYRAKKQQDLIDSFDSYEDYVNYMHTEIRNFKTKFHSKFTKNRKDI